MKPWELLILSGIMVSALGIGMTLGTELQKKKQGEHMSKGLIEKVEVRLGYTLNAGNYESVRVDLGVTRYIAEGEDTKDVMKGLRDQIRAELKKAGAEELKEMQRKGRG